MMTAEKMSKAVLYVGVKHLGDNLCLKPKILGPNASPSSGKCEIACSPNFFLGNIQSTQIP
jgi:hypothetical protein